MRIYEEFDKADKSKVTEAFANYWQEVYGKEGELTRDLKYGMLVDIANAMNEIIEIGKIHQNQISECRYVGEWITGNKYEPESYFHISGKPINEETSITYSAMGTDWPNQSQWILDMDNFYLNDCPERFKDKNYILAIILYELTFFGCSEKAIRERMGKWEKE